MKSQHHTSFVDSAFCLLTERHQLPIIILSARHQEKDTVNALDRGANDYLSKPFSVAELQARLRVALRHRARNALSDNQADTLFESGDRRVDLEKRMVIVVGE